MAASPGLEPRLTESESAVLPLDDEAIKLDLRFLYSFFVSLSNIFLFDKQFFYKLIHFEICLLRFFQFFIYNSTFIC